MLPNNLKIKQDQCWNKIKIKQDQCGNQNQDQAKSVLKSISRWNNISAIIHIKIMKYCRSVRIKIKINQYQWLDQNHGQSMSMLASKSRSIDIQVNHPFYPFDGLGCFYPPDGLFAGLGIRSLFFHANRLFFWQRRANHSFCSFGKEQWEQFAFISLF